MKKRMLSLALFLSLAVSLFAPATAAGSGPVTPSAPEWINAEDYIIFPDDPVYEPDNWAKIEAMRTDARNGGTVPLGLANEDGTYRQEGSVGWQFEVALVWMRCAANQKSGTKARRDTFRKAEDYFKLTRDSWYAISKNQKDVTWHRLDMLLIRAAYLYSPKDYETYLFSSLTTDFADDLVALDMSVADFFDAPHMRTFSAAAQQKVEKHLTQSAAYRGSGLFKPSGDQVQIFIDEKYIETDIPAKTVQGRTMIPIRSVAAALGADVGWEDATQQVTLKRAGTTIVMTLGSKTALVNGEPVEMDIAPYTEQDRTLLPVRYVAEFFGQKVGWEDKTHRVRITEDKSVTGSSNLETWALPMGAMLTYVNQAGVILTRLPEAGAPARFGAYARSAELVEDYRGKLAGWGIYGREDLVSTVISMTLAGHNASFFEMAADVKQRSEKERKEISEASSAWPYFMWGYTEDLAEKWGDRGILAWDLFRMSNLVQWGYVAGYVTYEEALALVAPAATLLSATFSSWDEAYENYLDGYTWWSRTSPDSWAEDDDVKKAETQEGWQEWMKMPRGIYYFNMKTDPGLSAIFDDSLFETGVIGLPEE